MSKVYTPLKIFRYPEKIASLSQDNNTILPPIHIRIKPTNKCNHRCNYCAYRNDDLQLGQDMIESDFIPRKKMMEIVDNIISMKVKAITFSGGGEPFVYPHLAEVCRKLAENNISFASLTNGSRLNGELADIFAKHATWLRISLDGFDDKSYSEYRNIKGNNFTNLLNNISDFKSRDGKCLLGVNIVVDHNNATHLYNLVQILKESGVDTIKFSPCIISNSVDHNNKYHLSIYDSVKDEIKRIKDAFEDNIFEIYDTYHLLNERFDKNYNWCPYQQVLCIIGADQNVYTCHDKAYSMGYGMIGSIKDTSFYDFWMNNKAKFFKVNPAKDCIHHCGENLKNQYILEYLDTNPDHLCFV